jgi:RimJ/RimL family protein N-acetyltransferase
MQDLRDVSSSIPALETERLLLRGHTLDDFEDSAAMWSDPLVTRYIGGGPCSREETWTRLLRYVGHWSLLGFGYWVVHEKATRRFVGEVGFAEFMRSVQPPIEGTPEIGWVLVRRAHGRGYATEAVTAALDWAETRFGPSQRTVCLIAPENRPSIRVAEKCGYERIAEAIYHGAQTLIFAREGVPPLAAA